MIDFNQYKLTIDGLNEGEQTHVNHQGCSAGTDTKRRLYFKRIEGGKILGYCHHCGEKGILKGTRVLKSLAALREPFEAEVRKGNLIPKLTYGEESRETRPHYFKAWLTRMNYYEFPDAAHSHRSYLADKVGYNHELTRIYVPYYWDDKIAGYQSRNIDPKTNEVSKWLTSKVDFNAPACSLVVLGDKTPNYKNLHHLVLEDLVSTLVVQETLDILFFPNGTSDQIKLWCTMGTSMPAIMKAMISRDLTDPRCQEPQIWYDNDTAGIQGKAKIYKELGIKPKPRVSGTHVFRDEPKNLGYYELGAILEMLYS